MRRALAGQPCEQSGTLKRLITIRQAREAARLWMVQEARQVSGFCGAYTAGSTNWLPDDAEQSSSSDLNIMVIVADDGQAGRREKFFYQDALLEASYLSSERFQSAEQILGDYHLAPSFRTAKVMIDPRGRLTSLFESVCRGYGKRRWVRQRCANARDKVLGHLKPVGGEATLHDQVMACLFAAGVCTHVLLTAGLRNPTVRMRYVAVRELLAEYGIAEFHETLLELLGVARIGRERARGHLAALTRIFDTASRALTSEFSFAYDIRESARPVAIDGSRELIDAGYYREAMFWIGVTHARCQKVLANDVPEELTKSFKDTYQELLSDLGLGTSAEIRQRGVRIEHMLPRVWEVAEDIVAANREVEED